MAKPSHGWEELIRGELSSFSKSLGIFPVLTDLSEGMTTLSETDISQKIVS